MLWFWVVGAVLLRQPELGSPTSNATNASNASNGTNYTPMDCYSQYIGYGPGLVDVVLGDLTIPTTVDFRLMNLSHLESEVRYCVDMNPKYNGDLFMDCRDGNLIVDNSSCFKDVYDPALLDFHMGVFKPNAPDLSKTQLINLTGSIPETVPWDQFILRFNEVVQAGSGSIVITELNPPELRRDYIGPTIEIPAEDYYQVFLGATEMGEGVAVIKSKQGHLKTKNGGQNYSIDIPHGIFLDRAGNPAMYTPLNSSSLHLQFLVKDMQAPSIVPDWVQAFFPMHGDQGRYQNLDVTITFDEPVFKRGNESAVILLEPRLSDDVACYGEFAVHGCGPVYLDPDHAVITFPLYGPDVELTNDGTTLAIYPRSQLEWGVTYAVVIAEGDLQDASGLNFTGLGTLDQGNYFFTTATAKQMDLREQIIYFVDYDERRLNDTVAMFDAPNPGALPWTDSFAKLRSLVLVWALGEARKILADPHGLPVELDLQLVADELLRDRLEPKGVPFSSPWTCEDFQSHMLQSVGFTCQPAVNKQGTGFDVISRTGTFFYRDGCFCQSHYAGGCPFGLSASTNYQHFGFTGMDVRTVNGGTSLCWYWSDSAHPEWGYMSSPSNWVNSTDPADDERLLRQYWSWHAAHRPHEAAARDPVRDHFGLPPEPAVLVPSARVRARVKTDATSESVATTNSTGGRLRLRRAVRRASLPDVPPPTYVKGSHPTPPPEPPLPGTLFPPAEATAATPEPVTSPTGSLGIAAAARRVELPVTPAPDGAINPMVWYG